MNRTIFQAVLISLLALCRPSFAQSSETSPPQTLPNTMDERVRACVNCHGQHGKGTNNVYFPRLAGKPAGYLYNQLVAFRDGRRKYAPMNYLLAYLPNDYLMKMAQYYADAREPFDSPSSPVVSQEVVKRGQSLVMNGAANRNIPACVTCHGPELSGREPGIPGLIGLKSDYISAQLGAWRYGTRTSSEPDCMQLIAARMTEEDVMAVAAWLAAMPIPSNTLPLKQSAERLPLECGSQKQ